MERTNAQASHAVVNSVASLNIPAGSWTRRSQNFLDAAGQGTAYNTLETWWAYSSGALTAEVITVTSSVAPDDGTILCFGVAGFTGGTLYQTAPWDQNAALPAKNTGSTTTTPTTTAGQVSTTNANTMLLYVKGSTDTSTGGVPTGFTLLTGGSVTNGGGTNSFNLFTTNNVVATTQTGITVAGSGTVNGWIIAVDALSQIGGTVINGSTPNTLRLLGVGK
jgi:hypothetical protein